MNEYEIGTYIGPLENNLQRTFCRIYKKETVASKIAISNQIRETGNWLCFPESSQTIISCYSKPGGLAVVTCSTDRSSVLGTDNEQCNNLLYNQTGRTLNCEHIRLVECC